MRLRPMVLVATLVMLGGLAGCASNGTSFAGTKASATSVDMAYVSRVERMALTRGVTVKWVNPPRVEDRQVANR